MAKLEGDQKMNLLERLIAFNTDNDLFKESDKILIACSGGIDSICLVHLLSQLDLTLGVIYFDHQTRDGESATDGEFVRKLSKLYNLSFHLEKVEIHKECSAETRILSNFQAEARNVRYHLLNEIADKHNYSKIATAHHEDDSIETFLINSIRGTGINGLSGIPLKAGKIIRPLLFLQKREIVAYVKFQNLDFVYDKSNDESYYLRNFIRNKVLSQFDKSMSINQGFTRTMKIMQKTSKFIDSTIQKWKMENSSSNKYILAVSLDIVNSTSDIDFILFHLLKPYGFNSSQISDAISFNQSGKYIKVNQYRLLQHNNMLILTEDKEIAFKEFSYPFKDFNFKGFDVKEVLDEPDDSSEFVAIPKQYVKSKLKIRNWRPGDYMVFPYGRKKVKKIFQEEKIIRSRKNSYMLLCYDQEVLWIFGLRKAQQKSKHDYYFRLS